MLPRPGKPEGLFVWFVWFVDEFEGGWRRGGLSALSSRAVALKSRR